MKKKQKVILIIFIIMVVALGSCAGYFAYISQGANNRVNDFVLCCAAGDTVKMETFLPSSNTRTIANDSSDSDFDKKIENELAANQKSASAKPHSNPSLQSVVLKCNRYYAKRIWSFTDKATATITVVGPDARKIVESTLSASNGTSLTQDQLYARLVSELNKSPKTMKKDINVPMTKIHGVWYVQFENREILDELTDGLITAYNESYKQALTEMQNSSSTGGKG